MTQIYIAKPIASGSFPIIGTMINIANKLEVTRSAVHKAYCFGTMCKNHKIEFHSFKDSKSIMDTKSKAFKLRESISLLRRCRLIIDDQNKIITEQINEHASIGIVEDIDRYFNLIGVDFGTDN